MDKQNFKYTINQKGRWAIESVKLGKSVYGKSIFIIEQKGHKDAPTIDDINNFIKGLVETERRNDAFKFEDGTQRPPQANITLDIIKANLEGIKL